MPKTIGERQQVLRELRRFVERAVDAEHRDPHRQPRELIVTRPELAAVRVDRGDRAPVGRDAARRSPRPRRGPSRALRSGSVRRDALLDVDGRVLRRQLRGTKRTPAWLGFGQAVETERPPVLAIAVPGDEVPTASEVDDEWGSTSRRLSVPSRLR